MTLAEICREANAVALANGWNDEQRTFWDTARLIQTDVVAAIAKWRAGRGFGEVYPNDRDP